jgi:prepilin-type N-terminal cleavage/methylation domain-containing protein
MMSSSTSHLRQAFTLVELLVIMAIIAILMTFALGAVFAAQENAREEKTRGLITKIDQIIMEKYESYRTRRVPLRLGIDRNGAAISPAETPAAFAKRVLSGKRELMRMELPDRFSDFVDDPEVLPTSARPALSSGYKRRYQATTNVSGNESAECLYLILALCGDDRAAVIIERNSGDTDADKLPEILDGWGQPIGFLRWPAGFLNNPSDPSIGLITELQKSDNSGNGDAANDPDPFDHRKVHRDNSTPTPQHIAYALYPLIVSAGPDKSFDIESFPSWQYRDEFPTAGTNRYRNNPYYQSGGEYVGKPKDTDNNGELEHLDNIHNHLFGVR